MDLMQMLGMPLRSGNYLDPERDIMPRDPRMAGMLELMRGLQSIPREMQVDPYALWLREQARLRAMFSRMAPDRSQPIVSTTGIRG